MIVVLLRIIDLSLSFSAFRTLYKHSLIEWFNLSIHNYLGDILNYPCSWLKQVRKPLTYCVRRGAFCSVQISHRRRPTCILNDTVGDKTGAGQLPPPSSAAPASCCNRTTVYSIPIRLQPCTVYLRSRSPVVVGHVGLISHKLIAEWLPLVFPLVLQSWCRSINNTR